MKQEIERKFLVDVAKMPDTSKLMFKEIIQGYADLRGNNTCPIIPNGCRSDTIVRIRQILYARHNESVIGEEYAIAIKTKRADSAIARNESETIIWRQQFHDLWYAFDKYQVAKRRYELPCKDGVHTVELDIYKHDLKGLIVAEVEFKSEEDAIAYEPEDWFASEITTDGTMTNASLAFNGLPEHIKQFINK